MGKYVEQTDDFIDDIVKLLPEETSERIKKLVRFSYGEILHNIFMREQAKWTEKVIAEYKAKTTNG